MRRAGLLTAACLSMLIFGSVPWVDAQDISFLSPVTDQKGTITEEPSAEGVVHQNLDELEVFSLSNFQPIPVTPGPPAPSRPQGMVSPEFAAILTGLTEMSAARGESGWRQAMVPLSSSNVMLGREANVLLSTDIGSLIGRSKSSVGVAVQKRSPGNNDPRPRGFQTGQVSAGGSYWFPARQDLDTMVSKLDSQLIEDVIVIRGPYSARHGPGFSFVDFDLLSSPRFSETSWQGSTSLDFHTNGQQWHGRQTAAGGSTDWGVNLGYTHRTANDYTTGAGFELPSSYNSRELNAAVGYDVSPESSLEFNYIRLDQTNVGFPGKPFDIDSLVTDAWELTYNLREQPYVDYFNVEGWYNRTRFAGNSQPPRNPNAFYGMTDVDGASMGYTAALTWGEITGDQLTFGTDLRLLKQDVNELNHFSTFELVSRNPVTFNPLQNLSMNKMVPKSQAINPGLFVDGAVQATEGFLLRGGARFDGWSTKVVDNSPLQLFAPQGLFIDDVNIAGQGDPIFGLSPGDVIIPAQVLPERNFNLSSIFLIGEQKLDSAWTLTGSMGRAQRAPTLTELYSLNGPFLSVLQSGGTIVYGNTLLKSEVLWQIDAGFRVDYEFLRFGATGFHAWVEDYITYRPVTPISGLPAPNFPTTNNTPYQPVQFTNTDLATVAGAEAYVEIDLTQSLTAFGTLMYLQGTDRTRVGSGTAPFPIEDFFFGTGTTYVPAPEKEPLPSIVPLESRIGLRLTEPNVDPSWGCELTARVVAHQNRVAATLLEKPTPGFTVWDVRGYWRVFEELVVVAGVENFTNLNYQEHLDSRMGTFQPGITFYAGAQLYY